VLKSFCFKLADILAIIYLVAIWYIFPRFGKTREEKSGNPSVGNQAFRVANYFEDFSSNLITNRISCFEKEKEESAPFCFNCKFTPEKMQVVMARVTR
jgi:hypothetical protein